MADIPLSQIGYSLYCDYRLSTRVPGNWTPDVPLEDGKNFFIDPDVKNLSQILDIICSELKSKNHRLRFFMMGEPVISKDLVEKLLPVSYALYLNNNNYDHPRIHQMPIGIRDGEELVSFHRGFTQKFLLAEAEQKNITKDYLCLLCFSYTHDERKRCEDALGGAEFVMNLNSREWESQSSKHCGKVPVRTFYRFLHQSHFVLSPSGLGQATHRFFEGLMLDSIPIVKKTNTAFDKLYNVFPCLVVDDWNQITREFLERNLTPCQERMAQWKIRFPRWWWELDSIMELLDQT